MAILNKISFLSILLFFSTCINAQCKELIENFSIHKSEFAAIHKTIGTPLTYNDSSILYTANSILIKHLKEGNVEWIKNIPKFRTSYTTGSNEIVGLFSSDTISTSGPNSGGIAKLSSNGSLIWAKEFNTPDNVLGYWNSGSVSPGKNGDIFLSNFYYGEVGLALYNQDLTQTRFSKHFNVQMLPGQYLTGINAVVANNSIFLLCYLYESSVYITKNDLLLIKLNYQTGVIEKTKRLHFNDELIIPVSQYISYRFEGIFSPTAALRSIDEKHLIVAGRKGTNGLDNNRLFALKIDTAFNIEKYVIYSAKNHRYFHNNYSTVLPSINKNGSILFSNIRDYDPFNNYRDSSYLLLTDNQLNIITQRKLSLADDVQLPGNYLLNSVPLLKDNGDMSLIFHTVSAEAGLINIVNIPSGMPDLPCRGDSADYIATEMPGFTVLPTPYIKELPPLDITITPYNELQVYNDSVEVNKFCILQSICDTLHIINPPGYCMVGDTASFTLIKNPQCLRKTIWEIDSNDAKILFINDTLLKVRFLKAFQGYIHARLQNCDLTDSVYVNINERLNHFSIGADTTLCPGNSITIHATKGYADYIWNNGQSADSLLISTPGIYRVEAKDYCGNTYADSMILSGITKSFSINSPFSICSADTAIIAIDLVFKNYQLSPALKGKVENSHMLLFPEVTTEYTISAEAFPGCIVSDTITLVVNKCPTDIIFPNAFSPNNDGLNDEFKPVVKGKLRQYRLMIYNRYGQIIFQSINPVEGWNGLYRNEMITPGVYTWACEYSFPNSAKKYKKGTVALIR